MDFLKIFLLTLLFVFHFSEFNKPYLDLLYWAETTENFFISDKIEMSYYNGRNKTYFAKTKIPKNTVILTIPKHISVGAEKIFFFMNNSDKLYNKLCKELKKLKQGRSFVSKNDNKCDKVFLSYYLYLFSSPQDKFKNNEIFNTVYRILNTYESNIENNPIFFSQEQKLFLEHTEFVNYIKEVRKDLHEEVNMLKNKIFKKRGLNDDIYMSFRLLSEIKLVSINERYYIVPFLDLFKREIDFSNTDYRILENGNIEVFTTKAIKQGEDLIILNPIKDNDINYILYNKVYKKNTDYEKFIVNVLSDEYKAHLEIEEDKIDYDDKIDLEKGNYVENLYNFFDKFFKTTNNSLTELQLYEQVKHYLDFNIDQLNQKDFSFLYDFFSKSDISNMKIIVEDEIEYYKSKSKGVDSFIASAGLKEKEIKDLFLKNETNKTIDESECKGKDCEEL